MSHTPPDFRIPSFDDDATGQHVLVRDVKPIADAAAWLVSGERKRAGQLSVLLWLVGVAISGGGMFAGWLTMQVIDLQTKIAAVAQHAEDIDGSRHASKRD